MPEEMSSEEALKIVRELQETVDRMSPAERRRFVEAELARMNPETRRLLARRILMDIFKRPRPMNDPPGNRRVPPRPRER